MCVNRFWPQNKECIADFRRADELAVAMEARGYRRGPRTTLRELTFSGWDPGAFAVMIALSIANLVLRIAAS